MSAPRILPARDAGFILVFNCGSSSIKFALFHIGTALLARQACWHGKVEGIGGPTPLLTEAGGAPQPLLLDAAQPYHAALLHIRNRLATRLGSYHLRAIVHRVVHGGSKYSAPVTIDASVLADLKTYIPLAPLHQPFALEAIEILLAERGDLLQIACFDTAFHHTLPAVEQMLPLPHALWDRGLRRYGFHGLSYEYLSVALPQRYGSLASARVIAAHLGSGASLCAMMNLRSVATTMGFSALDGLMMGTRCGSLDPGAVLYLMEIEKLTLEQVAHLLYHESGLLGVSGVSQDPPVLLAQEYRCDAVGAQVRAALDLYVRRIVREIGALVAILGGLDLLVFTAGIGEHSAELRKRICRDLSFIGIELEIDANQSNALLISASHSKVSVVVEPTNEEWIAARHALAILNH